MELSIITPEQTVFEGSAERVQLPGVSGKFEVLQDHAALISALVYGDVKVTSNGNVQLMQITGGFVEVLNNNVTVLAEGILEKDNKKK